MKRSDTLAIFYDFLAGFVFGDQIKKATAYFLNQIRDKDKVLIIGGGTGLILEQLPQRNLQVTYIDISEGMMLKAKKRKFSFQVNFITGSYTSVPNEKFDVLITPFFLDLFSTDHVNEILSFLTKRLKTGGILLFIDFVQPSPIWQKILLWFMYRFFRITCGIEAKKLPDFSKVFSTSLDKIRENYFYHRMIMAAVYRKSET